MTDECDFFTLRADKSQKIDYFNSRFNFIGEKAFYSPEMSVKLPEHWHEDIEFLMVREGILHYSVNGQIFELKPGDGIFVNSRRIHSNYSPKDSYAVFNYALIHPSVFALSPYLDQKYIKPLLGPKSMDYLLLNDEEWSKEISKEILDLFEDTAPDAMELKVAETSLRFLRLLYEHHKPTELDYVVSSQYVDTFKAMVTYITDNYTDKISLDDIASAGNVGKTLCAKIFKQFTTKNPGEYLIHYRVDRSMDFLKGSDLSITEIAYQTGFNSASHYTKTFREMVGCTPNRFRSGY